MKDRDVLLIDDILESGRTLRFAKELLTSVARPQRHHRRAARQEGQAQGRSGADYVGFECPDYFVVGYGMDVAYAFRELPFVGVVTGDA